MKAAIATVAPIWEPTPGYLERSRLGRFLRQHALADVPALVERADADPGWYWGAVVEDLGMRWLTPPHTVAGDVKNDMRVWFPGGRYNLALDAVDRWVEGGRAGERALTWEFEDGTHGSWDFAALAAEVRRAAAGLRALGVGVGDRVAIQLPMIPAAVVSTLACARIGAIVVPLFSGFGRAGSSRRITHSGARVHLVAQAYARRGRLIDALGEALAIREASGSQIETTLVVPHRGSLRPSGRGIVVWDEIGGEDGAAADLPAEHPLMLAFTSGTTGNPKGILLSHAGFAVKAGSDAAWCFDLQPGETAAWITDPGWVMFPITVLGGLVAGAGHALFDGAIDYPDAGRLWRFVDRHDVSMLGVSPTLVRTLKARGETAIPTTDLVSLRILASSGEPWTSDAFSWLHERVGQCALPIINYSGGTEVSGAILSNTTIQPVSVGGFANGLPGMGADVVDDAGRSVRGRAGELVLRVHSPGMTRGFWNEPERYHETYWARWPELWQHSDSTLRREDGIWFVLGRSDDTIKTAGKRVGPSEVEGVVNVHASVLESVAIGVPDDVKGDSIVVFVRSVSGVEEEDLADQLSAHVGEALGRAFRPKRIVFVAGLPKTSSGKVVRRLVRAAYLGEEIGDVSSLEDPSVVDLIEAAS